MKITSFHPMIATDHPEETIELFKSLGFEIAHVKTDIEPEDRSYSVENTVMKNEDGKRVEIAAINQYLKESKDTVMIRINVDDLEEAIGSFVSKGFKEIARSTSGSADYCTVESPTGYRFDLCHHIK